MAIAVRVLAGTLASGALMATPASAQLAMTSPGPGPAANQQRFTNQDYPVLTGTATMPGVSGDGVTSRVTTPVVTVQVEKDVTSPLTWPFVEGVDVKQDGTWTWDTATGREPLDDPDETVDLYPIDPFHEGRYTITLRQPDGPIPTAAKQYFLTVDKTSPTVTVTPQNPPPGGKYSSGSTVTVAVSVTDPAYFTDGALKGTIECKIGDGAPFTIDDATGAGTTADPRVGEFTVTAAETTSVECTATDLAGSADTTSAPVEYAGGTVSNTPPTVTLRPNPLNPTGADGIFYNSDPTVTLDVTDPDANLTAASCVDGTAALAAPTLSAGAAHAEYAVSTDGVHEFSCSVTDAGGTATPTLTVKRDATGPATAIAVAENGEVTFTGTDPGSLSGWSRTYYTLDGTPVTTSSSVYDPASSPKPVAQDGDTINALSVDGAGNSGAVTTQVVSLSSGGGDTGGGDTGGGDTGGGDTSGGGGTGGGDTGGGVPRGVTATWIPTPLPTPAIAQASATLPAQKLAQVLRKGLSLVVVTPVPAKVTAKLLVDRRTARKLRLKSPVLGSRSASVPAGRRAVRVPLKAAAKRALRRLRTIKAKVEVTVVSAQGGKQTIAKPVTLKR